jgi:omega-6 fatty acid desaturase (delta-12 desaturase)
MSRANTGLSGWKGSAMMCGSLVSDNRQCSIAAAPLAGLIYVIFNPRFTWLKGSVGFVSHLVKGVIAHPDVSIKAHAATFETRCWRSPKEYWHMFWNNVLLLSIWALMCSTFGTIHSLPSI